MSHESRRPLYVVPDLSSTRRGRVVDDFRRESGNFLLKDGEVCGDLENKNDMSGQISFVTFIKKQT